MCGASSPHSEVMVGMIPTISHRIHFPVPSQLGSTGAIVYMTVLVLNCMVEINGLHHGKGDMHPGPMMGIDRVQFHHLIGIDWARISLR